MIEERLNFCRVFELPENYPNAFCFGGVVPVEFKMVDWFNPIPSEDFDNKKVKRWEDYIPMIKEFLLLKNYIKSNKKYLIITDFDKAFIFSREE